MVVQQSARYFCAFVPAGISPRDRRFGGNLALRLNATGDFASSERTFERLRTYERNVRIIGASSGAPLPTEKQVACESISRSFRSSVKLASAKDAGGLLASSEISVSGVVTV